MSPYIGFLIESGLQCYRNHAWFYIIRNHNVKNTQLHLIPNEKSLRLGWSRAMKDIIMFNPMVTIVTPIPKQLHPPHRFECFRIFSRVLPEEVTRTQKEGIRSFMSSIDPAVHGWGATIRKYVVSGMPLLGVVLAIMRDAHLGRCRMIWTSPNRWWSLRV